MLSVNLLLMVLLAAFAVWFWHNSLSTRERANQVAMAACQRMGLQFLDGTVAFARFNLTRGAQGWLQLRRTYVFDYTATVFMDHSLERRQGFVVMLGDKMESIGFASEQEGEAVKLASNAPAGPTQVVPQPPPGGAETDSTGKVLDLAEWRRKHHRDPSSRPPSRNTWQ